jgi:hypothetical protein
VTPASDLSWSGHFADELCCINKGAKVRQVVLRDQQMSLSMMMEVRLRIVIARTWLYIVK